MSSVTTDHSRIQRLPKYIAITAIPISSAVANLVTERLSARHLWMARVQADSTAVLNYGNCCRYRLTDSVVTRLG